MPLDTTLMKMTLAACEDIERQGAPSSVTFDMFSAMRAALLAAREPGDDVVKAGAKTGSWGGQLIEERGDYEDSASDVWNAMVDAILTEKPDGK